MGILALDAIQRQAESLARRPVNQARSRLRNAANLNRYASRAAGTVRGRVSQTAAGLRQGDAGVVVLSRQQYDTAERTGAAAITAPDGYVRQTPVQELRTPADYYAKRRKRRVAAALIVVILGLAVYALLRAGILRLDFLSL